MFSSFALGLLVFLLGVFGLVLFWEFAVKLLFKGLGFSGKGVEL